LRQPEVFTAILNCALPRLAGTVSGMPDEPSQLIQMLGRLHPLLVHLPIGFIVVLAALEMLAFFPRFKQATSGNGVILGISVPIVIFSALFGWFLSWDGGYDDDLLWWHKWLGTALAPAVVVLLVFQQRKWVVAYRAGLLATIFLLTAAGHYGGSLTHGSDYLFPTRKRSTNTGTTNAVQATGQPVFSSLIQPILNEYCVSCHGPEKDKGGLKLNTAQNVFTEGDSGPAVERGNASASLLIKRMLLHEDEDEHMPPKGKPQPGGAQIALLKWWINVGAPTDKTTEELTLPAAK
jgi:uncharacterized membrane protein